MPTNRYYVYVIFRLNGIPCYVERGSGNRWNEHLKYGTHNKQLAAIYALAGGNLPCVIVQDNLEFDDSEVAEVELIYAIGRKFDGGPLVNQTDGGTGRSGYKHSEETKVKISAGNRGKVLSAKQKAAFCRIGKLHTVETCAKISAALRIRIRKPHTEEAKAKMRANHGGMNGKKHSEATKAKMRAARLGTTHTAATKAKLSAIGSKAYAEALAKRAD